MKENTNLKQRLLSEVEHLKVHGRTTKSLSPLPLFWTGSALELNVSGSELWIEVEADYDAYEPWICVLINSFPVSRQMITASRHWICIFRGMNENTVKNIRIIKELQAMNGDPACSLQIHAVKHDGAFQPVEEKPYKLEFIGDSITSGEGAIGAKQEEDWISMWFSGVYNYAAMTAEALNADFRIISQSGWGVMTGWDNNPHSNLPQYYEKVCGLLTGEKNKALGALEEHDFSSWQPDAIIVNLGTNDGGAFHSPEWKDPVTGISHKQRLKEDGSFHEDDLKAFEMAVENFLSLLRNRNKNAELVWAYGMVGSPMFPAISHAVENYRMQSGDERVSILQLPDTTEETIGARYHPGIPAHKKAAEVLSIYLKKLLL